MFSNQFHTKHNPSPPPPAICLAMGFLQESFLVWHVSGRGERDGVQFWVLAHETPPQTQSHSHHAPPILQVPMLPGDLTHPLWGAIQNCLSVRRVPLSRHQTPSSINCRDWVCGWVHVDGKVEATD